MPPAAMWAEIMARDGYRCRYCQRPVVHGAVLEALRGVLGPTVLPTGPTDRATHCAVLAFRAVADHVFPRHLGGATKPENLVTSCYPCNFGKVRFTLSELGLDDPRPPLRDEWNGLMTLLPALKKAGRKRAHT